MGARAASGVGRGAAAEAGEAEWRGMGASGVGGLQLRLRGLSRRGGGMGASVQGCGQGGGAEEGVTHRS